MNVFSRWKSSTNDDEHAPHHVTDEKSYIHKPTLTPPPYTPCPPPGLDEAQQHKVAELRKHVESIMLPEDHEYYESEKGFLTDGTLKRYMRARKWDYEATKTMLVNTIKWRREFKPDRLDPDYIRPEAETGKMYYNGFDKCGRPIWIMRPRLENSKNAERQIKHIVYSLERGIRLMPDEVENIAIIVDFKDSSSAHNPSIGTCKKFLDILGNHYPERLGIAFVVKSPWFFFTTFKLISPFMDPVTKAKIKFVYDDIKEENKGATSNDWVHIGEHINPDQLEADYGGDFNFSFDIDTYWNDLLEHTGNPYKTIEYR